MNVIHRSPDGSVKTNAKQNDDIRTISDYLLLFHYLKIFLSQNRLNLLKNTRYSLRPRRIAALSCFSFHFSIRWTFESHQKDEFIKGTKKISSLFTVCINMSIMPFRKLNKYKNKTFIIIEVHQWHDPMLSNDSKKKNERKRNRIAQPASTWKIVTLCVPVFLYYIFSRVEFWKYSVGISWNKSMRFHLINFLFRVFQVEM